MKIAKLLKTSLLNCFDKCSCNYPSCNVYYLKETTYSSGFLLGVSGIIMQIEAEWGLGIFGRNFRVCS